MGQHFKFKRKKPYNRVEKNIFSLMFVSGVFFIVAGIITTLFKSLAPWNWLALISWVFSLFFFNFATTYGFAKGYAVLHMNSTDGTFWKFSDRPGIKASQGIVIFVLWIGLCVIIWQLINHSYR
jgi:hypothetical protein